MGDSPSRVARLFKIAKTIRRLKPHLVQSQHFYTNLYAAVGARVNKLPSIGAVRNDGLSEVKANGVALGRLSLGLPSLIAANSQPAIRNLTGCGWRASRFFFLPNFIDTGRFKPSPERPHEPFTILGIGRLGPQKRFDRFVRMVERFAASLQKPVRAWIVGEGTQREPLQALISKVSRPGLEISLLGAVPDPLPLYQTADAFLLTSDHEGTPNVIMEAMACGLPVLATNVGGVAELITQGQTGFLFEPSDAAGVSELLERLLGQPDMAASIGTRARDFIERNHSSDLLPQTLATLYERVLGVNN
jgi:glycosyltransferase involved in cell wall biosynthesis